MELDKILNDAKSLRTYQSGPTLSELQSNKPSNQQPSPNANGNFGNDSAPPFNTGSINPNIAIIKLQELTHLFKKLNIYISRKSSMYCKHLLSILQRTLKMDLAFVTEHNINTYLFQPGTSFATTRSLNFISNLQSSSTYFQSEVVESLINHNIHAILTVPVRLESGKLGSVVAIHQSAYPQSELSKKQELIILDLANTIEEVLQVRPKEDWHEARMHLSLCFGLMSCLKPLLHEMLNVENHMNTVWKEIIQLMTIKAMSNYFIKEGFLNDDSALPRDSAGSIHIPTLTGTTVLVEEKRKARISDPHHGDILDSKPNLPSSRNPGNKAHTTRRFSSGGSALVSRLRPLLRKSVDSGRSTGEQVATIRQIALSYFTGDNHTNRVVSGGSFDEHDESNMSPLLSTLSKKANPAVPRGQHNSHHPAAVHPTPTPHSLTSIGTNSTGSTSDSHSHVAVAPITLEAQPPSTIVPPSFQTVAADQGLMVPAQLSIPGASSPDRVVVAYHAFSDPNYHDDLIVGQLAQLQLHLLSFQDTLLSMIESVERTITVAKGYLLTDRKKYIQSCSEFMTVGLVSKVNAILSKMSQKVLKNSLLWTFKVDSSLAHCCHRTFYHHLILFLENIIYYWAQYSTTTQLLIGFEPVERNMLTKHPYYVSTVEGFIKVLMRFPDRIDLTNVTPTSSKTPIYRKAISPANKHNNINDLDPHRTGTIMEDKDEEGGEVGQLSFRHASPYAPAEESSTSTNTTTSSGECKGPKPPDCEDTTAVSPPDESFHPVKHIHQLLSLLNSSLCRLNQSSTAATVNVRSDSCRITSQEAYFIRIPCMLYLTKAQDHAFLMNHGYRYVDNRNHVNGGPVAGANGAGNRELPTGGAGSSRYLPSNNPAHNVPVKAGIVVPAWVYYPLKSCLPFLANHVRVHSASAKDNGKRKLRRRGENGYNGTMRRPQGEGGASNGGGPARRTSKTSVVRPYSGGEDDDDNASQSSQGSHGSHGSQGSRNSQGSGKGKPANRKKSFGSSITPL